MRMQADEEFERSIPVGRIGERIGAGDRRSRQCQLHELPGNELRRTPMSGIVLILQHESHRPGSGGRDFRDACAALGNGRKADGGLVERRGQFEIAAGLGAAEQNVAGGAVGVGERGLAVGTERDNPRPCVSPGRFHSRLHDRPPGEKHSPSWLRRAGCRMARRQKRSTRRHA